MYIKAEDIYAATDGGLDIILDLYPQARDVVDKHAKMFKTHEEDTASTSLYRKADPSVSGGYLWFVTNFAVSQKGKNAIDCYMEVYGVDFAQACQQLAVQYRVQGVDPALLPKAKYNVRAATNEDEEGKKSYVLKTSFSDFEIKTLLPKEVLKEVGFLSKVEEEKKKAYNKIVGKFKKYNFYAFESYTMVINREVITYASTDEYPIFGYVENNGKDVDFVKLYQPLAAEKKNRFRYLSNKKPKHFMHGYDQLEKEYERRKKESEEDDGSYENSSDDQKKKAREIEKLDEIIIMSGGSDALCMAILGYWPVWPNSESADLQEWQIANFRKWAYKTYLLYDLDTTGRQQAHDNCFKYLDLHDIELPEVLLTYKDRRGGKCKDVRDYFNHFNHYDFKDLLRVALPYRFWDRMPKYAGRGDDRVEVGTQYVFNNVHAYNFLSKCGYFRIKFQDSKSGYRFVQRKGNVVQEIEANEIKNFIHKFLSSRFMDVDLRNAMFRTTHLSENSLSNLPMLDIEFNDTGKDFQYVVFRNTPMKVTAEGITELKPGAMDSNVWMDDVIDFTLRKVDPPFKIWYDEELAHYDIKVLHTNCLFFNYLVQTSRIHWSIELLDRIKSLPPEEREEYRKANHVNIDGPLLTDDERLEQRQHLINKLFTIGYLLHRHKDSERAWCVFAMDNHINEDGGSYGGSGKSLLFNVAIPAVNKNYFYLGGRNPKITENQFLYDGLTEHHRYILIDDADEFLNFQFFFDAVTGKLKVNPKNSKPYTIPFDKLGKYAITSNYTLRKIDTSTERRILYSVFSDYYHTAGEYSPYDFTCTPGTDLGKQLFNDFDHSEWNLFYNTMLYALQFYLSVPRSMNKINPPMSNVTKRNLMTEMTPDFLEWANEYFAEDGDNVDRLIVREQAFKTFDFRYKKGWKTQKFSNALRAFCKFMGYIYNPSELINVKKGTSRIMHKVEEMEFNSRDGSWRSTGRKVPKDMIYVQTHPDKRLNRIIESVATGDLPEPIEGTEGPGF